MQERLKNLHKLRSKIKNKKLIQKNWFLKLEDFLQNKTSFFVCNYILKINLISLCFFICYEVKKVEDFLYHQLF